jgi:hypothetical protein
MKKIIALTVLATTIASSSVFGQGYFLLTSGKSQAYDGFTTPAVSTPASTMNVAVLWAAASTTPTVSALLSSTPYIGGTNGSAQSYTVATAWSDILNGQFQFATNSATSTMVIQQTSGTGSVVYNASKTFGVLGTAPQTVYTVFEIAWSAAYATPWDARTAGGAVGWSSPLQYTLATSTDQTQVAPAFVKYGVFTPASAPEPSTMALAALGGASLLLFRRRK